MKAVVAILLLAACACAAPVTIRVNVFTATENPEIHLGDGTALLRQLKAHGLKSGYDTPRPLPSFKLGYSGFEIIDRTHNQWFAVYNNAKLESLLLDLVHSELQAEVVAHIQSEIERVASLAIPVAYAMPRPAVHSLAEPCVAPIRGPDNETIYDPAHDDCGWFITHQSENNCYNYGNNVVTNTFAQPGRGSGQKWKVNTCEEIRASAERDGLTWAGTELPAKNPEKGHYVALLIWPNTNFHWIRFDDQPAGYWSHKAGQTPVKNVDSQGKKITDPSKSDFAPWTQFCGYMISVPSKVNIN